MRVPSGPNTIRFLIHDPSSLGAPIAGGPPGNGSADAARSQRDGKPEPLESAHLIGTDDNPLRGDVRVRHRADGTVEIIGTFVDDDFAAVALPVAAGRSGCLHLQTCINPPRDEPYGLLVELARHRIKHFIQKCEEWQMWDPGLARGAMRIWDEARSIFAEALLRTDPLECERLARRSLEKAIDASEHLAMSHAEILLHRRFGSRPASSTTLGTVVRLGAPRLPAAADELLARDFDVLHIRADWRELEVKRGKPDFTALDRLMQWAAALKKPVMLGPLLDLREAALPDHARVYRHDYESFRNLAYDHLDRVASRYATAVGIWNVGSGFNANEFLELSVEQMVDLARRVVVLVRQRNRKANTLIELVDLFGENATRRVSPVLPWRYAELLQQEGIGVSALGLRLTLGQRGAVARDLFQISCMLDRFLGRDTRIMLSSFGMPAAQPDPRGGWWRDAATPETQASWAGRVLSVSLSKPFVEAAMWADVVDTDEQAGQSANQQANQQASQKAGQPSYALFSRSGEPRPVLAKLAAIRRKLRKPLGPRPEESA